MTVLGHDPDPETALSLEGTTLEDGALGSDGYVYRTTVDAEPLPSMPGMPGMRSISGRMGTSTPTQTMIGGRERSMSGSGETETETGHGHGDGDEG